MAKLPRFSLTKNKKSGRWELQPENSNRVIKSWATKEQATAAGVLKRAVNGRGSVRIHGENGRIQDERTYPRSADPRGGG
jgi:uncharacterized protein DUF2188